MLRAITRAVSPSLGRCELTYLDRRPIDVPRAAAQHAGYVRCLESLGVAVTVLPAKPDLPDAVFVEDPAVVLDEIAVIARMGAESRRPEADSIAEALAPYRPLHHMTAPATLDGGDVFRAGKVLYAGLSQRTNAAGLDQLRAAVSPDGYEVRPVEVHGCLHLKSGACWLGRETVLLNPEWVEAEAFRDFRRIEVAEPWAADVLPIRDALLMPDGFPETRARLELAGFRVHVLDVSELQKAEAGITCMSLIFEAQHGGRILAQ